MHILNISNRILAIAILVLFANFPAFSQNASDPKSPIPTQFSSIAKQIFTPTTGIISACIVGMILLGSTSRNGKNNLANAHWANGSEIAAARKKSIEQINRRERNKLSLYIVTPKLTIPSELTSHPGVATPNFQIPPDGEKAKVIQVSSTNKTIWLPDANRGIAVLGGTGCLLYTSPSPRD